MKKLDFRVKIIVCRILINFLKVILAFYRLKYVAVIVFILACIYPNITFPRDLKAKNQIFFFSPPELL